MEIRSRGQVHCAYVHTYKGGRYLEAVRASPSLKLTHATPTRPLFGYASTITSTTCTMMDRPLKRLQRKKPCLPCVSPTYHRIRLMSATVGRVEVHIRTRVMRCGASYGSAGHKKRASTSYLRDWIDIMGRSKVVCVTGSHDGLNHG